MKKLDPLVLKLKKVMDEKDLSAAVMARFIGCNQSQVGRWIKGQAKPTPVYKDLIRKALKQLKSY